MYSAAFLRLTALPLKAATVLCVLPVDSEGQQLPLRGEIVDVFRDDIPIGGARLVGVSVTTEDRRVDLQNLRAFLPSSTSQSLCVEVRSRDGRYLASAEFDASGVTPGAYQLPWNTRYSAKLKDYPEEDLSVLARLMDTCDGMDANPTIVVASWGAADLEPVVHFFFNVAGRVAMRHAGAGQNRDNESAPIDAQRQR